MTAGHKYAFESLPGLYATPPEAHEDFTAYYTRNVQPRIAEFEEKRLKALQECKRRMNIAYAVFFAIVLAGAALLGYIPGLFESSHTGDGRDLLGVALVPGLLLWAWTQHPDKNYRDSVKASIFPILFKIFGSDFEYQTKSPLGIKKLKSSGIIPYHDREHTEDYVKGTYENTSIELMEARLEIKGTKRDITVFQGIIILLGMNKKFTGHTVVKRDYGKVANWFVNQMNRLQNVQLEDPIFEREFEVYSSDQTEARYLLTTSFMERLLKLSKNADGIQCSFYNNNLLLMLTSYENRFEVRSINQPVDFMEDTQIIRNQMQSIFEIIDILKLNESTRL
jgi:hypothetical protein